jgi:Bacterial transcriptional activator domain
MAFRGAATFETWLLSEQRHVAAASEATLHEAALGSMSRGALDAAIGYAVRAAAISPLDENHQALLIRLYRLAGDDDAATKQFAACTDAFHEALGVAPGRAVAAAMREPLQVRVEVADDATVEAIIEAGSAAVSAGAVEAGIHELRAAVRLADRSSASRLRVRSRLVLAEALIHSPSTSPDQPDAVPCACCSEEKVLREVEYHPPPVAAARGRARPPGAPGT